MTETTIKGSALARGERLQIMLDADELRAVEDSRFTHRMPRAVRLPCGSCLSGGCWQKAFRLGSRARVRDPSAWFSLRPRIEKARNAADPSPRRFALAAQLSLRFWLSLAVPDSLGVHLLDRCMRAACPCLDAESQKCSRISRGADEKWLGAGGGGRFPT